MDYAVSGNATQMSPGLLIFSLAVSIVCIVGLWKVFVKAGKPGWASIVPLYNSYCMFDISWGNGWLFLLTIIPIVNIVVGIIMCIKLAKAFGKGIGFGIGILILSPIFICILGFGSAEYIGPQN